MIKKIESNLSEERNYFKPFNYPWAYEAWLKHEQSHWLHTEVPMSEDVKDWKKKLTKEEKTFLTQIFRFFTQGDIDVAGGYVKNYLPYFPQPEIRMMLTGFAARESLHIAAYYTIAERMVQLEDKFIDLAFGVNEMEGLSSEDVKKYIRYIADRRLISLGLKGVFKVKKNPLPWVEEMINAPTHTNFFENRATDYAKGALSGNWGDVWAH